MGSRSHEELWVPAEELAELNHHITGQVNVVGAFFGQDFRGLVPEGFGLKGKDAREQLVALAGMLAYSSFDFSGEIAANHTAIFINYSYWEQGDFTSGGVDNGTRDQVLEEIRSRWARSDRAAIPLGVVPEPHGCESA